MNQTTAYVKCERKTKCPGEDVYLKDVADVFCNDKNICAKVKSLKIYHFCTGEQMCVLSAVDLAQKIQEEYPYVEVQFLGEPDLYLERVSGKAEKKWLRYSKIIFVCLISFFGTAFTIMAYHNDIGINQLFEEIYRQCMNREPTGLNTLEVSYSLGLAVGIIIFFNHVGGKRITKDPTPIEVSMNNYDKDVDMTVIEKVGKQKRVEKTTKKSDKQA